MIVPAWLDGGWFVCSAAPKLACLYQFCRHDARSPLILTCHKNVALNVLSYLGSTVTWCWWRWWWRWRQPWLLPAFDCDVECHGRTLVIVFRLVHVPLNFLIFLFRSSLFGLPTMQAPHAYSINFSNQSLFYDHYFFLLLPALFHPLYLQNLSRYRVPFSYLNDFRTWHVVRLAIACIELIHSLDMFINLGCGHYSRQ